MNYLNYVYGSKIKEATDQSCHFGRDMKAKLLEDEILSWNIETFIRNVFGFGNPATYKPRVVTIINDFSI